MPEERDRLMDFAFDVRRQAAPINEIRVYTHSGRFRYQCQPGDLIEMWTSLYGKYLHVEINGIGKFGEIGLHVQNIRAVEIYSPASPSTESHRYVSPTGE